MITATTPELIAFVAGVQAMQNNWQEGELVGNPNFFTTVKRIVLTPPSSCLFSSRGVSC